jgi:hypothetical protein
MIERQGLIVPRVQGSNQQKAGARKAGTSPMKKVTPTPTPRRSQMPAE